MDTTFTLSNGKDLISIQGSNASRISNGVGNGKSFTEDGVEGEASRLERRASSWHLESRSEVGVERRNQRVVVEIRSILRERDFSSF